MSEPNTSPLQSAPLPVLEPAVPAPVAGTPAPSPWFEPLERFRVFFLFFFPFVFLTILERSFTYKEIRPMDALWWAVSFSLAMLGPAFIKARRIALGKTLQDFVPRDSTLFSVYEDYRVRNEEQREPALVGFLTACAFVLFKLSASWGIDPWYFSPYRAFQIVAFTLGLGFFTQTIWLILAFGRFVNALGIELENTQDRLFSWELLESAGKGFARTALGAAIMSLCVFWMFFTNFRMFAFDPTSPASQILFLECTYLLAVLFPIAYLVIPQWRLHRILVKRKEQIRALFRSRYLQTERSFLLEPKLELAQAYLLQRQMIQEIENLPEWPFKLEMIAPLLTMVAIPAVLFVFKEIVVGVLVELLKQ